MSLLEFIHDTHWDYLPDEVKRSALPGVKLRQRRRCARLRRRQAPWDAEAPPTDAGLWEKFHRLAQGRIAEERVVKIEGTVWHCADLPDAAVLITMLAAP